MKDSCQTELQSVFFFFSLLVIFESSCVGGPHAAMATARSPESTRSKGVAVHPFLHQFFFTKQILGVTGHNTGGRTCEQNKLPISVEFVRAQTGIDVLLM